MSETCKFLQKLQNNFGRGNSFVNNLGANGTQKIDTVALGSLGVWVSESAGCTLKFVLCL